MKWNGYKQPANAINVCFLNARSLHKHIDDVRNDPYYTNSDMCIFVEMQFHRTDSNSMYPIEGYNLYRNDRHSANNTRPYGGTAIYSRVNIKCAYPYCHNIHGIEVTVVRLMLPNVAIVALYRSPKITVQQMCTALKEIIDSLPSTAYVIPGDFNVNWFSQSDRHPLSNLLIRDYHYRQLILHSTTDYRTFIDHLYTNAPDGYVTSYVLESYFSDHKPIHVIIPVTTYKKMLLQEETKQSKVIVLCLDLHSKT